VTFKSKPNKEGYYSSFHRGTAAVNLWSHDRNQNIGKKGEFQGIGVKTAKTVEKYHVDLLGRLYKAQNEVRKPLPQGK